MVLATFTDPHSSDAETDYTALIQWGDGQDGTGTVVQAADGSFQVQGAHTYQSPGQYTARVQVQDDGSQDQAIASCDIDVNPAAPPTTAVVLRGIRSAWAEGVAQEHVLVAAFTDTNPADVPTCFRATIEWGDGTQSDATIEPPTRGSGDPYRIFGDHDYAEAGAYLVTVTLYHHEDEAGKAYGTALVGEQLLTATPARPLTASVTAPWQSAWEWSGIYRGHTGMNPGTVYGGCFP